MRKLTLVVALASFAFSLFANFSANTDLVRDYIARYQQIAIFESARSGIPASIILAQGIIESKYGTSQLSTEANNHFGIKWKSAEDGEYINVYDDDYDSRGNRILSRFIRYNSAEESYRHHTEFLKGPRYAKLFDYDRTDYRNWAYGLSSCHYATDPTYPSKLIRTIETYQLSQFDIPMLLAFEDEDNDIVAYNARIQNNGTVINSEAALFEVHGKTSNNTVRNTKKSVEKTAPQTVQPQAKSELYEIFPVKTNNKGIDNKQTPPRSGRTAGGYNRRY
jgi:hypothetical protein